MLQKLLVERFVEMRTNGKRFRWIVPTLFALIACSGQNNSPARSSYTRTLRDYASEARAHGEREALVPYGADEEEGEMLEIQTFDDALFSYEWIVGKPIEERTFGFARMAGSTEPDSIYTAYRKCWDCGSGTVTL